MKRLILFSSILITSLFSCATGSSSKEKVKKPTNIILMIGDGMGLSQIQAAYVANKGELEFLKFPVSGLQKTSSADNYITDSAAGGTAMATGKKTKNTRIGVDGNGTVLKSILEYAEENGLSTGLVATSSITHATPASFIAHQPSRYMEEEIAADFLKTDVDVIIGGGLKFFNMRKDGSDLTQDLKSKGYSLLTNIEDVKGYNGNKLAALVAEEKNPKISEGRGEMLSIATKKAIEILSKNKKGFFLMVEGSQIDWGGHDNNQQYIINELLDFNKAVKIAADYSATDKSTLVIVTADHETGGMTVLNGNIKDGTVESTFNTGNHTGTMVPVFATGPGSIEFTGVYENTAIFDKMKMLFGF